MNQTEYRVRGIRVERSTPTTKTQGRPPIIFVHGGCQGSWMWARFLPYFGQAGWDSHALNWFGHNGSESHPEVDLIHRGIADIVEEIGYVAEQFSESPIVIGHSMGGLAAQKYVEAHAVSALVLLSPVAPVEAGGDIIDLPLDLNTPWTPPPFEIARDIWFQGIEEDEARACFEKMTPESPKAVHEATRWTVPIDRAKVSGPVLVVSGGLDRLTPPAVVRSVATLYGADYRYLHGRGHSMLLEPSWRETARMIAAWLERES